MKNQLIYEQNLPIPHDNLIRSTQGSALNWVAWDRYDMMGGAKVKNPDTKCEPQSQLVRPVTIVEMQQLIACDFGQHFYNTGVKEQLQTMERGIGHGMKALR